MHIKNNADSIYVLENGIITNTGNHQKLLETSNFYSDYWTIWYFSLRTA